jgi:predicted PurR-regulated permease PerM
MTAGGRLSNPFHVGLLGGLGVLLALLIGGAIAATATILTYVAAAVFIALGLDPMVKTLLKFRFPRPVAVGVVVVGFLGFVSLLLWAIVPIALIQAGNLIVSLPDFVTNLTRWDFVVRLDAQLNGAITNAAASVASYLQDPENWPTLLGGVFQVGVNLVNGIVGALIITILTLYFMASLEGFKGYTAKLVAASKREKFVALENQIALSVGRWVMGQGSIALIHATALFILLTILGSPFALLAASAALALAFVPLVGPVSAGIIATLVSLIQSPTTALIVGIYYLIYLQIEAYLISPRVMRTAVSVPGAVVVISALVGGTLLGVLGALVAIPASAAALLIIREVWMPRQQLR